MYSLLQCIEIKTLKTITKDEKTEDHYTFDKSIPRIDSLIFYNFFINLNINYLFT